MTTHIRIADLTPHLSRRLPMARRHTESTVRHTIVALALAVALSGAAANVAAARSGGGGGHGGGFGHMGGGIGSDFVAGGGFGGGRVGGFGGGPVGGFGSSPVGGLEGSHFEGYGSHVGGFGGFDSHLGDPSVARFQGPPLAIAPSHFASPSALLGRHEPSTGTRLSMHYRGRHRMRYHPSDCFIVANEPYQCEPNEYCPCSSLP
jgi:hypothetical protein